MEDGFKAGVEHRLFGAQMDEPYSTFIYLCGRVQNNIVESGFKSELSIDPMAQRCTDRLLHSLVRMYSNHLD